MKVDPKAIKYGPITTKKIARNVWVATCQVTEPLKCEVNQQGTSEQNAIDKLKKFLNGDEVPQQERTCRVCGCTDRDCRQCVEKTGRPCHWVAGDLCSACV